MKYYRCRCGSTTSWTSMGVPGCRVCSECGSTLAQGPDQHLEPVPHVPRGELYLLREGLQIHAMCSRCFAPLREKETLGFSQADVDLLRGTVLDSDPAFDQDAVAMIDLADRLQKLVDLIPTPGEPR